MSYQWWRKPGLATEWGVIIGMLIAVAFFIGLVEFWKLP